jgi:hypothetical protein
MVFLNSLAPGQVALWIEGEVAAREKRPRKALRGAMAKRPRRTTERLTPPLFKTLCVRR